MTSLIERLVGREVRVVSTLGGGAAACVKLDPSHLEQIVVNLAVNARDAMPNGGHLTIETAVIDLPAPDAPTRTAQPAPGPYVLLTVSDTGVGMDEHVKRRLFEPFFTTKKAGEGTGLGLATVYGIVKLCGAYIWVESEPGQGSRFTICFPQVPLPYESAVASPASMPEPVSSAATPELSEWRNRGILVVEDDRSVRLFMCAVLRNAGYEAMDVATGEEALALVSRRSVPFHLIMADVGLPGIGGTELARQLRNMRPDARILWASGFSARALRSQGLIDETAGFLPKPFTRDQLLAAVQERLNDPEVGASVH
jgi:CheY-like chemotaxis protein